MDRLRRIAWLVGYWITAGLVFSSVADLMAPVLGVGARVLSWILCFVAGLNTDRVLAVVRGDAARLYESWKETTRRG